MASQSWPNGIPVEIFEWITSYLTRREIKALRLVCRDFEKKISSAYFRNVVVPFRPTLYTQLAQDSEVGARCSASDLLSDGMRIFQDFGPHILRFALSLEMSEDALTFPPTKAVQCAVPTFWGIYRWPHQDYHRYTDLEDMEQTADETADMRKALKCLTKVTNIGLCCDAGLGYLLGESGRRREQYRTNVFSQGRHLNSDPPRLPQLPEPPTGPDGQPTKTRSDMWVNAQAAIRRNLVRTMMANAGFDEPHIDEAINILLATEGVRSISDLDIDERAQGESRETVPANTERVERVERGDRDRFEHAPESVVHRFPLIPTSLSRAQKELLLELEWAHRAMIQSYVICLGDGAMDGGFSNLTNLTIAKIPSSHVPIFHNKQLWTGLTSLKEVSLGVVADWRRIQKVDERIVDITVSPLEAVDKVWLLLQSYLGPQQNIETLHFEWICGGEFAPTLYQRNSFILPAPFVSEPEVMAAMDAAFKPSSRLSLPYIKNLSLKNCWFSPHVLIQSIREMSSLSLEHLKMESVSICGRPSTLAHANLINTHQGNGGFFVLLNAANQAHLTAAGALQHLLANVPAPWIQGGQLQLQQQEQPGQPGQQDPQEQPDQQQQLADLENLPPPAPPTSTPTNYPDLMTWAGILSHFYSADHDRENPLVRTGLFTRAERAEKYRVYDEFLPGANTLQNEGPEYRLKSWSLKSCGYVLVDYPHVSTRSILPADEPTNAVAGGLIMNASSTYQMVSSHMQYCKDKLLGRVFPCIPSKELFVLEEFYGMRSGWEDVYDEQTSQQAREDGYDTPGLGRFTGTLL
ncbi:hypothetical protein B0I35DRAFT_440012 [Stachybotrys elegans]|uniref:F-box domain-containing protein n=1 Tax=Stachybotrys elegans TaxID=80388 RepID=A0A8K0SIY7_9HYPO|nr:hypothetical protein B0I35DRAFT_440012 [Stachybotrys elegans]